MKTLGRNDICNCGSGYIYINCCGKTLNGGSIMNKKFNPIEYFKNMKVEYQNWLKNGKTIHLIIVGETDYRFWSFDPKKIANFNDVVDLISPILSIHSLYQLINDFGKMLDNNYGDQRECSSLLNEFIGQWALSHLLASDSYKSGIKLGSNSFSISYLRSNNYTIPNPQYLARFTAQTLTMGTETELMGYAFGSATKIIYAVNKNQYMKSPLVQEMLKSIG